MVDNREMKTYGRYNPWFQGTQDQVGKLEITAQTERGDATCVSVTVSNVEVTGDLDKKNLGGQLKDKVEAARLGSGKAFKGRE